MALFCFPANGCTSKINEGNWGGSWSDDWLMECSEAVADRNAASRESAESIRIGAERLNAPLRFQTGRNSIAFEIGGLQGRRDE